jgi:hypothetical protein
MVIKEVSVLREGVTEEINVVHKKIETLSKGSQNKISEIAAHMDRLNNEMVASTSRHTEGANIFQYHIGTTVVNVERETRSSNINAESNIQSEFMGLQSECCDRNTQSMMVFM